MRRPMTLLAVGLAGAALAMTPLSYANGNASPDDARGVTTVQVDPNELPDGPPPRVPYYHEGTKVLHDGPRAVEVDLPRDDLDGSSGYHGIYPVRGGYVVRTRQYDIHPRLFYVRYAGSRARIGGFVHGLQRLNVVVGADRSRIAYVRYRGGAGDQVVEVRRVRDGSLVARRELGQGAGYSLDLFGLRDSKVWFADEYGVRVRRWDIARHKVTTFDAPRRGVGGLRADLSARRVVIDRGTPGCVDVVTIPKKPAKRWRSCGGVRPIVWSPDDKYVVGFDDESTAVVRRSGSGAPVIRFEGLSQGGPMPEVVWESADTFIADAYVETDEPWNQDVALVRCSVQGDCEQIARWSSADMEAQLSMATRSPS